MAPRPKNILLTGPPGCGKTTVIRRVVEQFRDRRLAGLYTEELRQQGQRVGFAVVGLDGQKGILAHLDISGKHRVGRYGVDVDALERIVHDELGKGQADVDLYVVDEIGKMECFSALFREAITKILAGPVPVLATIAIKGGGFIGRVKMRPDVEILTVTVGNRDRLPQELAERLQTG